MDPKIWCNLPTELIQKIIEWSDPSIDTQLFFKIKPKKIDEAKAWRLWWLLKSHDGLIYNLETKSLHNFRVAGSHIIRRPIELNYHTAGLWVFNDTEDEHTIEVTSPLGSFHSCPSHDHWATEMRVLLKGSGLARAINMAAPLTF
ncbi:hypothetical protein [Yellowstone lake phycodnavirus 3]|uniref:hypothetical protein n=1 Tax=Yellowstone lake phycodnavirus 3 TaxID=1586715 RepID=UPI0006EB28A1|nr:hypothetical protein AR677_gp033 [Yellowstone lake phycodnavirus 3]BAT22532.1 hypothetical protein [Yellowstone lake phycodnavirus 3]